MYSIVIPPRILKHFPDLPPTYVLDRGIVFYVYAPNNCSNGIKYMPQTTMNARYIKKVDPTVCV